MLNDLKSAAQFVFRRRGFSAVAALTLALGIAANVTVFALVRSVLLKTEPYRNPHELFTLVAADHFGPSPFELFDLQELQKIPGISHVAACTLSELPSGGSRPALVSSSIGVSEDFFRLLDAPPLLGRTLQTSDFGDGRSAVISYELWDASFGRSSDVIGRSVELNWRQFTVVGVMPPTFAPPCGEDRLTRRQAWIPLQPNAANMRSWMTMKARVDSREALSVVQARIDVYGMRRSEETGKTSYAGMFLRDMSIDDHQNPRPALLSLQALAGGLLLIACANLGSLLLLDASRRDSELATRTFLGATHGRILRQLLLESTVLAIAGGIGGAALSLVSGAVMRTLVAPILPRGVAYDVRIPDVAIGAAAGIGIALLFACASALIASRRARQSINRASPHGTASASIRRFQNALVAIQVGLSVVLAIATGVVGMSYVRVARENIGFDASGVVTSTVYLPPSASTAPHVSRAQYAVASALRQSDNTLSVSFSDAQPFSVAGNLRLRIDDSPRSFSVDMTSVTPNYFDVLRIKLMKGRLLSARESYADVGEAVANASFVRMFGGADHVLGRIVHSGGPTEANESFSRQRGRTAYRIVGVIEDIRTGWRWTSTQPGLYVDLAGKATRELAIIARTAHVSQTQELLQQVIAQSVPSSPRVMSENLETLVWRNESERIFYMTTAAAFAFVALVIAGIGTYTAVGRMVALRTKEFAIRMSLGATPARLHVNVLWRALVPVGIGISAGLLSAAWLGSFAKSLQHASQVISIVIRTTPNVVPTIVIVAVGALVLAAIACWFPARRAASVDPAVLMKGG